jgi:hypothetical protein
MGDLFGKISKENCVTDLSAARIIIRTQGPSAVGWQ